MDAAYFTALSSALREAGIFRPCLVIDRDRLDRNIARVKRRLSPVLALRLVDKSLPSLPLLDHIATSLETLRFMTFHLAVTAAVMKAFPDADFLFGKPMPVEAVRQATAGGDVDGSKVCWLIDTEERLAEYGALSEAQNRRLRIAFEVDVGLHRGGFAEPAALRAALAQLGRWPKLACDGIMAYEAHAPHIPGLLGGPQKALALAKRKLVAFAACLDVNQRCIINAAGSQTALLYDGDVPANDVSIGSAFVLPKDFDTRGLSDFEPACFIATPILKVLEPALPGPDFLSGVMRALGKFPARGCFTYGGKWMAVPVHPAGMAPNALYGLSSNQQFFGLPRDADAKPGDYAFLRPTQSEAVLQQFGPLQVFSSGKIVAEWPVLPTG